MAGKHTIQVAFLGDTSNLKKSFEETESSSNSFGTSLGKVAALAGGVATVGIAADFLKDSMKEAAAEQQNMAVLNHTLDDTVHATEKQKGANEQWITSMQNATGISRDELEPAEGKLLIAGRSLAQAHSDMAVAADIAAARHIDLGTVVQAMGKAAEGSTGALGKLGIQTKDAAGHALSYDQILQSASKTMGGTAAAAADTAAGRAKILGEQFKDLKVSVGEALLPVMEKLTSFLSEKVLPSIQVLANWIKANVFPVLKEWGDKLHDDVLPVLEKLGGWIEDHKAVFPALGIAIGAVLVPAMVSWAISAGVAAAAMVVAAAPVIAFAFVVGVVAYEVITHWDTIKNAALGLKDFVVDKFNEVLDFFKRVPGYIGDAMKTVADVITSPYREAFELIKTLWNNTVGGFGFDVPSWIPGVGGKGFKIPKMAGGGIVDSPTLALIGESGPEAVVPLGRGGFGFAGGGDIVIQIDGREIARAVRRANDDRNRRNGF